METSEPLHVDDWLDQPTANEAEALAKEFLEHCRRPAYKQDFGWIRSNPLFCTYRGKRYRCTGASRLGDVWLTSDFKRDSGYDLRIEIEGCSDWSREP